MGLTRRVGTIFGWFDNLDLLISTPNGRRETHVMTHEFQQHPSSFLEMGVAQPGVMNLVIPRLFKTAARNINTRSVPLQQYTGPKKVNPPIVPVTSGIPYTDLCKREISLTAAQMKDYRWLNTLSSDNIMEWYGSNNRDQVPATVKHATVYIFGPLLDILPSHPDKVLTSMFYMTLGEMEMTYGNLSIDMQLYMVGQQVKWFEPEKFKNVIIRSGAMHITMSFLGCTGTLMKGSGLEVIVGAAFSGLTGITNGKV